MKKIMKDNEKTPDRAKDNVEFLIKQFNANLCELGKVWFEHVLEPFLIARGWYFFTGNGQYWIGEPDNLVIDSNIDLEDGDTFDDDPEFEKIVRILNVEVDQFNVFAFYMPDYVGHGPEVR